MNSRSWTEADLRAALDRYEDELRQAGKARNTIATYVQHPERFINWLVGTYQPTVQRRSIGSKAPLSRYDALRAHLTGRSAAVVRMTFAEIEAVLGAPLPASARNHRAWWANEEGGSHVHARAWLGAGRRTSNVSLKAETVEFLS